MAQYKINTKCKVIEETAILMCVCVWMLISISLAIKEAFLKIPQTEHKRYLLLPHLLLPAIILETIKGQKKNTNS